MSHRLICAVVVVVAALTAGSRAAEAQSLRVLPVPWVAADPTIPHQAYNGHATTFKAIARGGNGTYVVEWDFDGNGVYDFSATRSNRYDLSTTFTYPSQATTTTFQATVRVTSNAQVVTGTYPVRVFADVPLDPNAATDRQLQVMRSVAVDDALWYLHNQLTRSGNEEDALTGAQATGYISQADNTIRNAATSGFLWSLSLNGHYAAFPPAYIGALPDAADNAARWANDPYAEDAMRVVNGLLLQATIVGVDAASESNLTGFYPEVQQEPIYGTDDGIGIWIGYNAGEQTITRWATRCRRSRSRTSAASSPRSATPTASSAGASSTSCSRWSTAWCGRRTRPGWSAPGTTRPTPTPTTCRPACGASPACGTPTSSPAARA
ncbi:MAG: hypothetical protein IPH80_29545 [Myxococcales bacterium]|nr:hypothetical protein [Myxococcales bacterium]